LKDKQNIRYVGFESTDDGGRRFDFSVSPPNEVPALISIDVSAAYFTGSSRILVQEAPSICFLKVKELCEVGLQRGEPIRVSLSGTDIGQYREVLARPARRWQRSEGV
jgi:hypothetical protein